MGLQEADQLMAKFEKTVNDLERVRRRSQEGARQAQQPVQGDCRTGAPSWGAARRRAINSSS